MDQEKARKTLNDLRFKRDNLAGLGVLRCLPGGAVVSTTAGKNCPDLVAEFSTAQAAAYFVDLDAFGSELLSAFDRIAKDAEALVDAVNAVAKQAGVTWETQAFRADDFGRLAAAVANLHGAAVTFKRRNP